MGDPVHLIPLCNRGRRGEHIESIEDREHRLECERLGITYEPKPLDPNDPRLWPAPARLIGQIDT